MNEEYTYEIRSDGLYKVTNETLPSGYEKILDVKEFAILPVMIKWFRSNHPEWVKMLEEK